MISFKHIRCRQASKRLAWSGLVFLLGLSTGGCDDTYGEISGRVYYKGQPLTVPGAVVKVIDANGGILSSMVASDGAYTLAKVPVGPVKVAVVVLPTRKTDVIRQVAHEAAKSGKMKISPEEREKIAQSSPSGGLAVAIPPNYADPHRSGLMHTVTGGKQTYDIQLR